MTEDPFSTQGWNRYSYVGNSPINFTDPSAYCFLGRFWKPIFKTVGNFFRQSWRSIVQIAVTTACYLATSDAGGPVCAAAGSFVAGITSGDLGETIRDAITATGLDASRLSRTRRGLPTLASPVEATTKAGGASPMPAPVTVATPTAKTVTSPALVAVTAPTYVAVATAVAPTAAVVPVPTVSAGRVAVIAIPSGGIAIPNRSVSVAGTIGSSVPVTPSPTARCCRPAFKGDEGYRDRQSDDKFPYTHATTPIRRGHPP